MEAENTQKKDQRDHTPDEDEKKKQEQVQKRFSEIEKEVSNNKVDIKQLYGWYREEIERKEEEIKRLRKDNELLFKTAFKAREGQLIKESINDQKHERSAHKPQ